MLFKHTQITFAREYRGYSQSELASRIKGLSQPNLSKHEKGLNILSEEMVLKIIDYLNFPKEWLLKNISNFSDNTHYRKRATLTKGDKTRIGLRNRLLGYLIDQMSDSLDWPAFSHVPLDIQEGHTPTSIARHARKVLGLINGMPVINICTLLEAKGIIVVQIDAHIKFDGVSFISDGGTPVIIINRNFSNDRKRRTLAHEYGHILMHCYFAIPPHRNEKCREEEVEEFTSEFLMPELYIKPMLRNLRIGDLAEMKKYWHTSMSSIVRRAKDLGLISKDRYRYFNIELSRGGRSDDELKVPIDEPNLFTEAYKIHKHSLGYSNKELAKAFCVPLDVIEDLLEPNKLRVIS